MQGELVRLGHPIAAPTVWQVLHDAGNGPAPRRNGPTWKQFLTTQARSIIAVDFVQADTLLLCLYALIVIDHGTRRAGGGRVGGRLKMGNPQRTADQIRRRLAARLDPAQVPSERVIQWWFAAREMNTRPGGRPP